MEPEIPEDVQRLCLQLRAGQYDDDTILHIAKALGGAIADGTTALRWSLNLPGLGEIRWGQVTPNEAEKIERELGRPWVDIHPGRSAIQFNAIAKVFYMTRSDPKLDEGAALAKLDEIDVDTMIGAVDTYVGPPLKAASPQG